MDVPHRNLKHMCFALIRHKLFSKQTVAALSMLQTAMRYTLANLLLSDKQFQFHAIPDFS